MPHFLVSLITQFYASRTVFQWWVGNYKTLQDVYLKSKYTFF